MVDQGVDISRIGVLFGEDFQQGKLFAQANIVVNKEEADKQKNELLQKTGGQVDVDWALVLEINALPEKKDQLFQLIKKITTTEQSEGSQLHTLIYKPIEQNKISVRSTMDNTGKIFVSIKPEDQEFDQVVKQPLTGLLESGLQDIANNQCNKIELSISTNSSVDEFVQKLDQKERISAALFSSFKFDFQLILNQGFAQKLKEILSMIDPELASIPPLVLLRYFKSLDMDFRFKSTSELPEDIRKKLLFGSKFENKSPEELVLKKEMDVVLSQLIELIETDVDIYVTVPGFLKISLKLHAPLLANFFKKYLGGIF